MPPERYLKIIGIIGSLASVVGLALFLFPMDSGEKAQAQQAAQFNNYGNAVDPVNIAIGRIGTVNINGRN